MNSRLKLGIQKSKGLSLIELLVSLAIVSGLAIGVGFAVDYFQKQSAIVDSENQLGFEALAINAELRKLLKDGSKLQAASGYGMPDSPNGNFCYRIETNKPVSFSSTNISNGAVFEYRVAARAESGNLTQQNREPNLASTASLGTGALPTLATMSRTLSMWVKLPNVVGNDRVLFDYSADVASYRLRLSVVGGNTVHLGMGGTTNFIFNVANIRNGAWHHLVVEADRLNEPNVSPVLYVDGVKFSANAASITSTSAPINPVASQNYKIDIGSAGTAKWSLGPVGLWSRTLSEAEIAKLGRMESVSVDNAFWLPAPMANLSTRPSRTGDVTNETTINARSEYNYLLFKKDSESAGQVHYKMYKADNLIACPDPAEADDPISLGFELLTASTCVAPAGNQASTPPIRPTQPLLVGNSDLRFKWNCNLSDGKREAAATVVTGGAATGAIIKSAEACEIPISADEFKTTASTNTAFLIMDDFDPGIDLLAFEGNAFPEAMPITDQLNISRPASISNLVNNINWYADVDNSVGMYKVTTPVNQPQTKEWWVANVFKKLKYKTRSDVYAAERSLVFVLGDAWPIKVCPSLGYKAKYHFYKVVDHTPNNSSHAEKMRARYTRPFTDSNQHYHGMRGYLANMRCPTEKDQIARRVLTSGVQTTLGMWTVRQEPNSTTSTPNFAIGRESWNAASGQVLAPSWGALIFGDYQDDLIKSEQSGGDRTLTEGKTTWRIIGGAKTDNNVIVLTDHTLCDNIPNRPNGRNGFSDPGASFSGCQGVHTLSLPDTACQNPEAPITSTTPACLLQKQVGGNRQYNWWKPRENIPEPVPQSMGTQCTRYFYNWGNQRIEVDLNPRRANNYPNCVRWASPPWNSKAGEPNKSGAYIWMGYNPNANADTDFWDDMLLTTQINRDLIEFGDHPHDAALPVDSPYRAALRRDNDTAITSTTIANEDHDPPNMISKTMKSTNALYCK